MSDPKKVANPRQAEAVQRLWDSARKIKERALRKNAARMEFCNTRQDSPKTFLTRTGPIAAPNPREEYITPMAIEMAEELENSLRAYKGIRVMIPPEMASPDFKKVRTRTMGSDLRYRAPWIKDLNPPRLSCSFFFLCVNTAGFNARNEPG